MELSCLADAMTSKSRDEICIRLCGSTQWKNERYGLGVE